MPDLLTTIPLREVYPDLELSLEGYVSVLKQLSRTDALMHAARLNTVLSNAIVNTSLVDRQIRA